MNNPRIAIIARSMAFTSLLGIQSIVSLGQEVPFLNITQAYSNGDLSKSAVSESGSLLDTIILLKNENRTLPIVDDKLNSWQNLIESGTVRCINLSNISPEEISQQLKSIKYHHETSYDPLVVVITGALENMPPAIHAYSDALLYSWNSMENIKSEIFEVILGKQNPFGRLPYEVLYQNSEYNKTEHSLLGIPNRKNNQQIQFPFGFGLSYSSYSYEEISLNKRIISEKEDLRVSVKVRNLGPHSGIEQVQVYLIQPTSGNSLPPHRLIASRKISLDTGQTREVQFTIRSGQMAQTMKNGTKEILPGAYIVTTAGSSPINKSVELGMPKPISISFAVEFPVEQYQNSYSWKKE